MRSYNRKLVPGTDFFHDPLLMFTQIFCLLALLWANNVHAAVTVTAATGGSAIPSNTTSGCSASGTWTTLTNPRIAEGTAGNIGVGSIVLTAPAGFEFNTSAAVTILLAGSNTSSRNINNLVRNNSYPVTSITDTEITFNVFEASSTTANTLTWQNIQVRPTASTPLASGNITETGSSILNGASASTNFGSLTETASVPQCQPSEPTATTTAASSISATGATLNGRVSSNGASSTVSFDYGLTTGYGSTVNYGSNPLSASASNSGVSAAISGLTCNVTYNYRVKAVNSAGTGYGNNLTFNAGSCPMPTITSISPINKIAGDATFTMTVNGTNFVATSQVQFAGSSRTTTYVSPTQLTASIPATDLITAGVFNITVVNTSPGGGTSNAVTFSVLSPTITSISPINKNMGDATFTMTVTGTNFLTSAQVQFAGSSRTTTYVSPTQLTASILASDLTTAGVFNITVVNSPPGGGTSNAASFSVLPSTAGMSCFTDNFNVLNTSNWNVIGSGTGYYTPNVTAAGRLRMTDATTYRKSMAQLQRWFPGAGNALVLTFDYFAYSGSGADGLTITLSDASTTPAAGGYGGSLGYAQNTNASPFSSGFNGGWLGIGLDEWGNFPNPNEGRTDKPTAWVAPSGANTAAGFYPNSVVVRGSGTGTANNQYMLLANTGTISPALWTSAATQNTPQKYRIIFDHSNSVNGWLTVQRDTTGTGNSYTTLIPTFDVKGANSGQLAVPTNFYLSLTASTGASTNIHEFDELTACATVLQPVGGGIHHIEITSSNASGSTCQPITLTIKACANAACQGYTSTAVSGTLTANTAVTWGGSAPNFDIPAGNITTTVSVTVPAGTTTFGVNSATINPAATNATTCNLGGTNACLFTGAASGFSLNIPNHISCTSQAVTLIGTGSGCSANFYAGLHDIKVYNTYSNPLTGTQNATIRYRNNTAAPAQYTSRTISNSSTSPTTLTSVYFDSSSTADMSISYPDVGQLLLTASATSTPVMTAGSDAFIVAPASFTIDSVTGPFIAGKNFSARVTAKNQCNATTPNFGKEAAPEDVTITHSKNQPAGAGSVDGTFACSSGVSPCVLGGFNNGEVIGNDLNWSEVGNIYLTARVQSGNYLGSNVSPVASGISSLVGNFIPDHFILSPGTATPGCGSFTYFGQDGFSSSLFTITAKSFTGNTTQNYLGSFAKLPLNIWSQFNFSALNAPVGSTLAASAITPSGSWVSGVATVTATHQLSRPAMLTPETLVTIQAQPVDSDGVSSVVTSIAPATALRFGRLDFQNAYGSQLLDLPMAVQTQYWNGSSFVTNSDDNCTSLASANLAAGNFQGSLTAINIGSYSFRNADSNGSCSSSSTLNNTLVSGIGCLLFAKPTSSATGSVDLLINTGSAGGNSTNGLCSNLSNESSVSANKTYLSTNNNGCSAGFDRDPTAHASFGVFKGNSKQIYYRELY